MQIDKALRGLARNPALPADLLRRLLHHREACGEVARWRADLTEETVAEILAFDDDWRTLCLAGNENLPHSARTALARSTDLLVRGTLAARIRDLPEEAVALLAEDTSPRVRARIAADDRTPTTLRTRLAHDPDPHVRAEAARTWAGAPEELRRDLLTDDDPHVRAAACEAACAPPPELHPALLADPATRAAVVRHLAPDPALAKELATDEDEPVRRAFAAHPGLPPELHATLARDSSPLVRAEILLRADTTADVHAGIRNGLTAGAARADAAFAVTEDDLLCRAALDAIASRTAGPDTDTAPPDLAPSLAPDLATRLAADDDVRIRREAATHPDLPVAALRALLADDDEDESVVRAAASSPALPVEAMEELLTEAGL